MGCNKRTVPLLHGKIIVSFLKYLLIYSGIIVPLQIDMRQAIIEGIR
jgi:hypothetical protein